ncbi:hypothetical protein Gohar_008333, partial [Gossypium harknessii]|nr:hypothetical protein [Gossypium harknessii]
MIAANGLLGKSCYILLSNPNPMVPSLVETGARLFVTKFLSHFISTGSVILLENGGTMFTFEGTTKKCSLKTVINVHNPHFYWKVMTAADISLANAYINGDISFVDKRYAGLTSAKYCFKHFSRRNTHTQARRNISRHYDLVRGHDIKFIATIVFMQSNKLFALFMDETMAHAVFKTEDEDLTDAQQRILIEKVIPYNEILEIGCGWGGLAIEVVKRTGCKYTGITLSEEQLKLAEKRVKEAGLQ